MEHAAADAFTIDIISDVVCPWCYIGKHRLEEALRRLALRAPGTTPVVRWHPFELNPDLPPEGVPRQAYLAAKFGGAARAGTVYERVRAAGEEAGLALDFDRIERQPNTLDAHRLLMWAQATPGGDPDDLVERLFQAYFVDGRHVGDAGELARIAGEAGFDADEARAMLASDALRAEVAGAEARARRIGVQGVPFFVFDGTVAVSGAHEPDALVDAILQAREKRTSAVAN